MAIEIPSDPQQGIIKPVHINTDEAPWTVTVAENDAASYSVYVKSACHTLPSRNDARSSFPPHRPQRRPTTSPSPVVSERSAISTER